MSTRANIIIKDGYNKLYFYRYSDGYPEGTLPTLNKFVGMIGTTIRDNVGQAAGWLVILGAIEYQTLTPELFPESDKKSYEQDHDKVDEILKNFAPKDWKVGAYEPTTGLHGDIEYLYVVDLQAKDVRIIPKNKWKNWEAKTGLEAELKQEKFKTTKKVKPEKVAEVTVLKNSHSLFEVNFQAKSLDCYDLDDKWNDTKGFNRTSRSIKKAWAELVANWTDEMRMYAGCSILSQNGIRMHTYCGMD